MQWPHYEHLAEHKRYQQNVWWNACNVPIALQKCY